MVGICTSAGLTASLTADDERIKSIATVAAFLPSPTLFSLMLGEEGVTQRLEAGAAARRIYEETGKETIIPAYSETDQNAVNFGPAGSFDYYLNKEWGNIPEYKNEFAVMSYDTMLCFDPIGKASGVKVPAIVVHSDESAFPDNAKKFYSELQGPKELVWADGNHYDYYDSPAQIENAVKNITRFFNEHVG